MLRQRSTRCDLCDHDGCADHVGGALLTFGASRPALFRQRFCNAGESIVNRRNLAPKGFHLKPGNAVQETYRSSAVSTLKDCNLAALAYRGQG
jgi:hypothetical protein